MLLNQLPGVLCPPEPWFLLRLLSLADPGNPDAAFGDGYATLGITGFLGSPTAREPARAFAMTAYNGKLAASGKSIFVDKTPRYYHILPEIFALFPKARFIWLQRNPLDVVASYKATWNLSAQDLFSPPARPETLDFIIGLDVLATFFATKNEGRCIVRYEDLATKPAATLKRLQGFLGIASPVTFDGKISRSMLAAYKEARVGDPKIHQSHRVHSASVDRWRTELSSDEIRLVLDILGIKIFQKLGFGALVEEIVTTGWKAPDEDTALRRRKSLRSQLPGQIASLIAEKERLLETVREQTTFTEVLKRERARLTSEANAAKEETKRAVADSQKHIDGLTAQLNHLVKRDQQIIDKLNAQLATVVERDQQVIDRLNAQLAKAADESRKLIDQLRNQLEDLAASSRQQNKYITTLKEELGRLQEAAVKLAADCTHYVQVISEQTAYIRLLELQRKPGSSTPGS